MQEGVAKTILSFVSAEPRTIADIAKRIGKSWKTADKYVARIAGENPSLCVKVFRKGSQGALKVVYLKSLAQPPADVAREKFFKRFQAGQAKEDFDVLDVFMHVQEGQKNSIIERYADERVSLRQDLISRLDQCRSELLCFSGNLSWINMVEQDKSIMAAMKALLARKARVKVLCRVDAASIKNIKKLKALDKDGLVDIRHQRQPLRGFVFDGEVARLKEEVRVLRYKKGEISNDLRIIYDIFEPDWVRWFENIFTYSFNNSMGLSRYEDVIAEMMQYL